MSEATISYKADLVGVFGYPVAENPTGVMQKAAFQDQGLNWRYLNIEVQPKDLGEAMIGLRAFNMQGVNLTIPHKVAVIQYLDRLSPEAELIGAVNTVVREGDALVGHNTDGKGFLRSVRDDAVVDSAGKRIVFLGAGGAARAMSVELALAGAASIAIVNRTPSRGQKLNVTPIPLPWQPNSPSPDPAVSNGFPKGS
jgi:shikimate dehydrogenase